MTTLQHLFHIDGGAGEQPTRELESAVKNFDREAPEEAAKKALKTGIDPIEAIEKGLMKGLREVGDIFGKGELFITHLITAAEAMSSAIKVLELEVFDYVCDMKSTKSSVNAS